MRHFILLLIACACSHWSFASQPKKGYIYPAFEVTLDADLWSFDQQTPSYLQVSGYFQSDKQRFKHLPSGLQIEMRMHIMPIPIKLADLDTVSNRNFGKVYKNLYRSNHPEYMQVSYYLVFEPGYYLFLECNKSLTDAENEGTVKQLIDAIAYIGAKEMDRRAGYPLPLNSSQDSLLRIRKKACLAENPKLGTEYYIDHLLLLDAEHGFTFERWEKEMMIEHNMLYSEEDMALADAQIRIPANVEWLMKFMPNHYFQLDHNSYKELRRYIHRSSPTIDYRVERITRKRNQNGVAFLISSEDTLRFFNVHVDADKKVSSYNYYICRDLSADEDSDMSEPLMIGGKPNEKAWNYTVITPSSDMYLIEKNNSHWEKDFLKSTFSTTSLHSAGHAFKSAIVFEEPKDLAAYDLLVEFKNNQLDGEANYFAMMGLLKNFKGQPLKRGDRMPQISQAKRQAGYKRPLLKSPVLVSDFDADQHPEFTVCYVSQGHIVFADCREISEKGVEKWPIEKCRKHLLGRIELYELCMMSFQSMEDEITEVELTDGYYDSDDYPVMEDELGSYEPVMAPMEDYRYQGRPSTSRVYEAYECSTAAGFPGGEKAMEKYIAANVNKPSVAQDADVVVYVTCNILVNGAVQVETAMNSNGKTDEFTQEAKRLVATMPLWTPAKKEETTVSMKKIIPIIFKK
jgi:hypothetical protein